MSGGRIRTVLIVGEFSFSRGEASSNYVIGLGHALREAGFGVEYLAAAGDARAIREDFKQFVCHQLLDQPRARGWRGLWGRLTASGNGICEWLLQARPEDYHAIVAYPRAGYSLGFLLRLQHICRSKDWRLVNVVVEWYAFRWPGWRVLPHEMLTIIDWRLQFLVLRRNRAAIIAVSSLLEQHFRRCGCDALRVPPTIDARADKWTRLPAREKHPHRLVLLFSGSWGRDRLDLIIEAIGVLRRDGHDVVLRVLGAGQSDLHRDAKLRKAILSAPAEAVSFHGYVPVDQVLPITASADLCLLLRAGERWSNACFPSKVAEVQALGIPMLCNITSDLAEVLKDGENALIVPEVSTPALVQTVKRALALTAQERQRLRLSSLQQAQRFFDYRNYVKPLGDFVGRDRARGNGDGSG